MHTSPDFDKLYQEHEAERKKREEERKKMEEDKNFANSEYVDILKYGMSKQLKLKHNKYNNTIKNSIK